MNKNYIPFKIIYYLIKEFTLSLFVVLLVFVSLVLLINFVDELSFFKEQNIDNLILLISYLSIIKMPNTIIELSIFIFLFSGITFFIKIKKNNEINTILLSGISKLLPVLTPAIFSFCIGLVIIFFVSPVSSYLMESYEITKKNYSNDNNLIVVNDSGFWFVENLNNSFNIIRANKISNNNFSDLKNVTIYNLDKNFNFLKRIDSKEAKIKNKSWNLSDVLIFNSNNIEKEQSKISQKYNDMQFSSSIKIDEMKSYFLNSATVSFWNITNYIETLNNRGYSADELKIKLHKYLSLPFYIFGMIILSTIFTLFTKKDYNTLMYLFFGIIVGFFVYFLNDLSTAAGLSNKLPLTISVWAPVMILMFLSFLNLLQINDK